MTSVPTAPIAPKVALVLGSGGLNSLAALPLIGFLATHGVRPDLLVGCSGGSLILTMLACGYTAGDMADFLNRCLRPEIFPKDWWSIATMVGLRPKRFNKSVSVFKTDPIFKLFREVAGDQRLEDLPIPMVLQATDFNTGEGVELASGRLVEAVYASCAAYPIFHPIQIDGRWLIDGAFSAPLPILAAVRRGVDIVITMDFSDKLEGEPTNFIEAMIHVQKIFGMSVVQSQMLASIDLLGTEILHVKVRFPKRIKLWETTAYALIQAAGHQAVEEYGAELLTLIRGCTPRREHARSDSGRPSPTGQP